MQITIGINQNVFINKVEKDATSQALLITFNHKDDVLDNEINYFEALQEEKIVDSTNGATLRIFAPNEPKADLTEEKRRQFAFNDIKGTRAVIEHLLQGYMSADEATTKDVVYANTGLDRDNFNQKITQKPILMAIHSNLVNHFIQKITPFLGKRDLLFRLLLLRQSADKPYAAFRTNFISDHPFWESMDVPEGQSKVKFTDFEIGKGLNSAGAAPEKKDADKKNTKAAPQSASSVFGSGSVFGMG